jgi:phosphoglycerate dehydrogenase-like enzyme
MAEERNSSVNGGARLRIAIGVNIVPDLIDAIRRVDTRIEIVMAHRDAELRRAVRDADVLFTWAVPDNVPTESPHLRWIQLISAGADHLRVAPVWSSTIVITSSKGIHAVPVAEHTFGMILALTRKLALFERAQQQHEWLHRWDERPREQCESLPAWENPSALVELYGKTLGIIGWGSIGAAIAHLAHAFGMRVIGTRYHIAEPLATGSMSNPFTNPPLIESPELEPDMVYPTNHLLEVLRQSDVVVLVLPDTPQTTRLIGAEELRAMRPGSLLVNVGRGNAIDEPALIEVLHESQSTGLGPYGAALDVCADEPLPVDSPLWDMPNVIITPHVAGISDRTHGRAVHFFCANLTRYLREEPLLNVVDRSLGY